MRPGLSLGRRAALPALLAASLTLGCAAPSAPPPAPPTSQGASAAPATTAARASQPPGATATPPAPSPVPAAVTLKGTEFGVVSDAVLWLGLDRGYFAEQGITLDLTRVEPIQVAALLATGQADLGIVGVSTGLFQALGRGVEVRFVADAARQSPRFSAAGLSVRKDLLDAGRVRDYPDLRGLNVGLAGMGGITHWYLGRALERGGLGLDDVNIVNLSQPDMPPAFANGVIDAGMQAEPFATIGERQNISRRWKSAGELAGDSPMLLMQFSQAMASEKRAAGERFMVAYTRSIRDYYDAFVSGRGDRAAAIDVMIAHSPVKDRSLYDDMSYVTIDPNPYVDAAGLTVQQEWFFNHGMMPELRAPVDLAAFADRGFVDHALSVLGPYR